MSAFTYFTVDYYMHVQFNSLATKHTLEEMNIEKEKNENNINDETHTHSRAICTRPCMCAKVIQRPKKRITNVSECVRACMRVSVDTLFFFACCVCIRNSIPHSNACAHVCMYLYVYVCSCESGHIFLPIF